MPYTANKIRSNIKVSGIASWYVKADVGDKYQFTVDDVTNVITVGSSGIFADTNTVKFSVGGGGVLPAGLVAGTLYFVISTSGATFKVSETSGGAEVNITDSGTVPFYIGKTDRAFYSLGNIFEGKVNVNTLSQSDSLAQPIPFSSELVASCRIFNTDKTNVLKILDSLSTRSINHVINTRASGTFTSNGLTIPIFGTKWKFVSDGDANKVRYLEITANRRVIATETTTLLTTAAPSYGTALSTDALYPLNSLARSGIIPAGFSKFEICASYNGTFQDVGSINNGKLTVELLTSFDASIGGDAGYAMQVSFEVDGMQMSSTELAQMQSLATQATYVKITLLDGTVVTLGNATNQQIGINWQVISDKDSTGEGHIHYSGGGIVQSTELDAIFA